MDGVSQHHALAHRPGHEWASGRGSWRISDHYRATVELQGVSDRRPKSFAPDALTTRTLAAIDLDLVVRTPVKDPVKDYAGRSSL